MTPQERAARHAARLAQHAADQAAHRAARQQAQTDLHSQQRKASKASFVYGQPDIRQLGKARREAQRADAYRGIVPDKAFAQMRLSANRIKWKDFSFEQPSSIDFIGVRLPFNSERRGLVISTVFDHTIGFAFGSIAVEQSGFVPNFPAIIFIEWNEPYVEQGTNVSCDEIWMAVDGGPFAFPVTLLEGVDL